MNRKDGVTSAGGGEGGQVGEREVQIKKMTNEYKDPLLLIAGHITLQTIAKYLNKPPLTADTPFSVSSLSVT